LSIKGYVTDDYEWAHYFSGEKLPMRLDGPITTHEKSCRCH
jgi:hypothetical protein